MNPKTTDRFRKCYNNLPVSIKKQVKDAFKLFLKNPYHPGLHFKRIHSSRPIFSVRITKDYRAIGISEDDDLIWFWIGSHSDYENLINHLRK